MINLARYREINDQDRRIVPGFSEWPPLPYCIPPRAALPAWLILMSYSIPFTAPPHVNTKCWELFPAGVLAHETHRCGVSFVEGCHAATFREACSIASDKPNEQVIPLWVIIDVVGDRLEGGNIDGYGVDF